MFAGSWLKKASWVAVVSFCVVAGLYADEVKQSEQRDEQEPNLWQAWKQENISEIGSVAQQLIGLGCKEVSTTHYPELYAEIQKLVVAAEMAQPKVFVVDPNSVAGVHLVNRGMPASLNAFASGIDKDKDSLIVISKDLVDIMTPAEVTGIVAHEISHIKHEHAKKTFVRVILPGFLGYMAARFFWKLRQDALVNKLPQNMANWCRRNPADCDALMDVCMQIALVSGVCAVVRHHEKQADLSAVKLTRSKALASALGKLDRAVMHKHPLSYKIQRWVFGIMPFLRTHPTTETRKKYINAAKIELEVAKR